MAQPARKSGPGSILAFELDDPGPLGKQKRGGAEDDVRLDAAKALCSILGVKGDKAKQLLSALDSVMDLREAEDLEESMSLDDLDDLDDDMG